MIVREMSYHLVDGIFRENGVEGVYEGKSEKREKGKRRKKRRLRKVICSSIHGLRAEFHPSKVEIRVRVPVDALF